MLTSRIALCSAAALILFAVTAAHAQQIGLGPDPTWTSGDSAGGRTNIEEQFVTLGPGTYSVTSFQYTAINNSGTVQPFLALSTATNAYTPIWTEPATAPSAS